ncbi:MAG TPA: cation:proton antiporter [Jatrophihabitans sp.]
MSFTALAVVGAAALIGPLLALRRGWQLPVLLGELAAGILLGRTGIGYLHSHDATFTMLGDIGFALVMFVAGSHVPVRGKQLRPALRIGIVRAGVVGVVATGLAVVLAAAFGTGHPALYAVVMASSSAALILPIVDSLGLSAGPVLQLLPQVAIADTVCIVALPLAIDPKHAARAAAGAAAVAVVAVVSFLAYRELERRGLRKRLHDVSEERKFALELRINLVVLFALAGLAVATHISIMLAGFAFGLAVAGVGEPRRLARQLFALTEGFFGPLFFVWLGASLNLRELGSHPRFALLGIALGLGAILSHGVARFTGQPLSIGLLAAAQLGVPVAATTIGAQTGVLSPGESGALLLGALVTIAFAVVGGGRAASEQSRATAEHS